MRIVYYSHPAFFEPTLCLVRELSRRVELHLMLEVSPAAWQTATFDLRDRNLPSGIIPADEVLRDAFPSGVRDCWQAAASFQLVVHASARSLHPSSWATSRKALRFIEHVGADVLHVDDVDVSPRLALALPGFRRGPLVLAVHDPTPHSGERNWRKLLARRLVYSRADRFVLYNAALRGDFAATYGIPPALIAVTHLGVYDVFPQWPSPVDRTVPTVLFFGRLSRYKGLDIFYDAARLISRRLSRVRFVVAGRPVEGYTPPRAPALGDGNSVEVIDRYLSNTDAAALFRSASVVVCPYRDATQSGVALSAFAFGVPVVATTAGGLPEYVVHHRTGLLIPPDNATALADAVIRVLEDPALAASLQRGIREAAANELGWDRTADALLGVYGGVSG